MLWKQARQTRIFVPSTPPFESGDWYEQVLGRIVLPLFLSHCDQLHWLWFTKYVSRLGDDDGDCEIDKLPSGYLLNGVHRSIRLRFSSQKGSQRVIEANGQELVNSANCFITDWRDYDVVKDLGGDRFAGAGADLVRRTERAKLVVEFLYTTSKLVLSCLISSGNNGRWQFEDNPNQQNPYHSSSESIHHLFCNMTQVPLYVLLLKMGSDMTVGTHWRHPDSPPWNVIAELPVGF